MSEIKVEIPPLECPAVLLPTPKNLMDFFGKLATEAEKAALSEIEDLKKQGEELKKILDSVRSILSPYDPDFKAISIPEQEFKIMIQRLIEEFHIYVPTKILELINSILPISLTMTVPGLGISIDILKVATDREYLKELAKEISGYGADVEAQIEALRAANPDMSAEELNKLILELRNNKIDSLYKLLPDEYKQFGGEYGLDNAELKAKQVMDFIKNEVTKFMNGELFSGFGGLISKFDLIWSALGLPSLPVPLSIDIEGMIKAVVDAEKAKFKAELESLEGTLTGQDLIDARNKAMEKYTKATLDGLGGLSIAGFGVLDLLGGEIDDNVVNLEFQVARITQKLKEFKENWQTFLLKEWMNKVTAFFDAIGLGALTQWITFDFCMFMTLIGIPKTIDLSGFGGITEKSNEFTSALGGQSIVPPV